MSSSNRWTRTSAAEAKAKASSSNRRQEFHIHTIYDDDERHSSPPGGYAPRRHEELPPRSQRTRDTVPYEDHMAFSKVSDMRQKWFQAHEE